MPFTDLADRRLTKNHGIDRVFVLEKLPGHTLTSTGLIDNRLFSGDNKLHAIMNPVNCFWSLKYESGNLPSQLRDITFTGFGKLLTFVEEYFKKRNIAVKEIIDYA